MPQPRRPVICRPNLEGSPGLGPGGGGGQHSRLYTKDSTPRRKAVRPLVPEEAAIRIREGGPLVTAGNVGLRRLQAHGQRGTEAPAAPEAALRARPVPRVTWASLPPRAHLVLELGPGRPCAGGPDGAMRVLTRPTPCFLSSLSSRRHCPLQLWTA